jgi:hypothetical protein
MNPGPCAEQKCGTLLLGSHGGEWAEGPCPFNPCLSESKRLPARSETTTAMENMPPMIQAVHVT